MPKEKTKDKGHRRGPHFGQRFEILRKWLPRAGGMGRMGTFGKSAELVLAMMKMF